MDSNRSLGIFQNQFMDEISDCRINAVEVIDNYIIIGDDKGTISTYEVNVNNKITVAHSQFVTKGKVEQIKSIPHLNLIYVLVNGHLYGYQVPRLELKFKFESKDVGSIHRIATNDYPGLNNQLLLITKKRKVKCYEYNHEITKLIEMKIEDLIVLEASDIVEWYGSWFCYSLPNRKKFFWINIKDGVTISNDLEVVHVKNVLSSWLLYTNCIGVFMEQNTPKQMNTIMFSQRSMLSMGIYKNYVISLHDTLIGVFDANDSSQVQEVLVESGSTAKFLAIGQKRVFYINSGDKGNNYRVWELKELAFEKQISKLLNDNKIEEALNILNNNIPSSHLDKPKKIEQFFLDCSWICIRRSDFQRAYRYAKLTNFNPFEFIYLFHHYLNVKVLHEEYKHLNNTTSITSTSTVVYNIENITNSDDALILEALKMISDLLTEKRNLLLAQYEIPKDNLKKVFYLNSDESMINLANSKSEFPFYVLHEVINTTLIKALVKRKENTRRIWEVVDSENFTCDWEDLDNFLIKENYDESKIAFAYLNERRNKFEEALKIWMEYGTREGNAPLSREAMERTKIILKKSQDKKLFHDYIQWILVKYPKHAFELFVNTEIVPVEYFFSTVLGSVEKNGQNLNLKEKFLEYYIENGCNNERFHTILAETYIEKIFKIKKADTPFESSLMEGNLKNYIDKLEKLLTTSTIYNKNHILEKIKGSWMIDQEIYLYSKLNLHNDALLKLINIGVQQNDFEKVENYCTKMLTDKPDLFAELFKILSENYNNYATGARNAAKENERKILENAAAIYQRQMLVILKKFGDCATLDPFLILEKLPVEWTVSDSSLYEYLTKVLKSYIHLNNKYKIARNLSDMALIYKEKELAEAKNKSVTIENETCCEYCKKKIGNTIFCVYPNMKVYHMKCASNPNVCPTTRVDFTRKHFI